MKSNELPAAINNLLQQGTVIPAHPLALKANLKLDEERQGMLTRYYIASGAGGIAVGVHTTQFEIRNEGIDLLEPVLKIAAEEITHANLKRPFIKVAGIRWPDRCGIERSGTCSKIWVSSWPCEYGRFVIMV